MRTTFGKIKRGQHFSFEGHIWKRTKGRFAIRVIDIGNGHVGWPFNLKTTVETKP